MAQSVVRMMKNVLPLLLLAFALSACGAAADGAGDYDDTCFDCRTVCEGAEGDELDFCLGNCSECQGYSDCFAWLEYRFDGMQMPFSEWQIVDCSMD